VTWSECEKGLLQALGTKVFLKNNQRHFGKLRNTQEWLLIEMRGSFKFMRWANFHHSFPAKIVLDFSTTWSYGNGISKEKWLSWKYM